MAEIEKQLVNILEAKEVPWRPGYQNFPISGKAQGMSISGTYAILQPGAGAPLHFHDNAEEVLVILEGSLDLRIGDERTIVGPNTCISVPPQTPHGFTATGPGPTKFVAYLNKQGAYLAATYLEGGPAQSASIK